MKKNIIYGINDSVSTIIKAYLDHRCKIFYVLNDDSALIGTITQGDLLRAIAEGDSGLKTLDIMQHNSVSIKSTKEIDHNLIDFLSENHIDEIPIVDDNGKIIKIYSIYDILKKNFKI